MQITLGLLRSRDRGTKVQPFVVPSVGNERVE
jgi:hypothetical protein